MLNQKQKQIGNIAKHIYQENTEEQLCFMSSHSINNGKRGKTFTKIITRKEYSKQTTHGQPLWYNMASEKQSKMTLNFLSIIPLCRNKERMKETNSNQ